MKYLTVILILITLILSGCESKKSKEEKEFTRIVSNGDRNTTGILNEHPIRQPFSDTK